MHRSAPQHIAIDQTLIELLQNPAAYPHPVESIELIETHISWVLLTGDYVYKIKKPLNLGFLDFGTLERRQHFCEEEIRLNKPWAPSIYIDVVPISIAAGRAVVNDSSQVVEYAVRMWSFDQGMRLDSQLEAGNLSVEDMRELGAALARRHSAAKSVATCKRDHAVQRAKELIAENFLPLQDAIEKPLLDDLCAWTNDQLSQLGPLFTQRFNDGFFRECHGDLHLGNLVRLPDGITMFDCIEFNDDLRDIDVLADIAFVVMDLVARRQLTLAVHFLNRYLEFSGDYEGMRFFNLYFTYRCLVRAKIAVIRSRERDDEASRNQDLLEAHRYCEIALRQIPTHQPLLVVMTGLSGSGKTWVSSGLLAELPAIRVRSDIERKRHFGLAETTDSGSDVAAGIYTDQATADIYDRMNTIARTLLDANHNVIIDATFLNHDTRAAARSAANASGACFALVQVQADDETLRARIVARKLQRHDASEAGTEILDHQLQYAESLSEEESRLVVRCNSERFDAASIIAAIHTICPG